MRVPFQAIVAFAGALLGRLARAIVNPLDPDWASGEDVFTAFAPPQLVQRPVLLVEGALQASGLKSWGVGVGAVEHADDRQAAERAAGDFNDVCERTRRALFAAVPDSPTPGKLMGGPVYRECALALASVRKGSPGGDAVSVLRDCMSLVDTLVAKLSGDGTSGADSAQGLDASSVCHSLAMQLHLEAPHPTAPAHDATGKPASGSQAHAADALIPAAQPAPPPPQAVTARGQEHVVPDVTAAKQMSLVAGAMIDVCIESVEEVEVNVKAESDAMQLGNAVAPVCEDVARRRLGASLPLAGSLAQVVHGWCLELDGRLTLALEAGFMFALRPDDAQRQAGRPNPYVSATRRQFCERFAGFVRHDAARGGIQTPVMTPAPIRVATPVLAVSPAVVGVAAPAVAVTPQPAMAATPAVAVPPALAAAATPPVAVPPPLAAAAAPAVAQPPSLAPRLAAAATPAVAVPPPVAAAAIPAVAVTLPLAGVDKLAVAVAPPLAAAATPAVALTQPLAVAATPVVAVTPPLAAAATPAVAVTALRASAATPAVAVTLPPVGTAILPVSVSPPLAAAATPTNAVTPAAIAVASPVVTQAPARVTQPAVTLARQQLPAAAPVAVPQTLPSALATQLRGTVVAIGNAGTAASMGRTDVTAATKAAVAKVAQVAPLAGKPTAAAAGASVTKAIVAAATVASVPQVALTTGVPVAPVSGRANAIQMLRLVQMLSANSDWLPTCEAVLGGLASEEGSITDEYAFGKTPAASGTQVLTFNADDQSAVGRCSGRLENIAFQSGILSADPAAPRSRTALSALALDVTAATGAAEMRQSVESWQALIKSPWARDACSDMAHGFLTTRLAHPSTEPSQFCKIYTGELQVMHNTRADAAAERQRQAREDILRLKQRARERAMSRALSPAALLGAASVVEAGAAEAPPAPLAGQPAAGLPATAAALTHVPPDTNDPDAVENGTAAAPTASRGAVGTAAASRAAMGAVAMDSSSAASDASEAGGDDEEGAAFWRGQL